MYYLSYKDPDKYKAYEQTTGFEVRDVAKLSDITMACQYYVWSPILWATGVRKKANFIKASLCAFDFDEGVSLEEAKENIFADMVYVIATTKSHRVAKGNNPACDRFRVVIPFEREIVCLREYQHTMKVLASRFGADASAVDGARFFWPSRKAELWAQSTGETMEVIPAPFLPQVFSPKPALPDGVLPNWIGRFLTDGELCLGVSGRNNMVMRVARWAKDNGWSCEDITARVMVGNFDRTDFKDYEIRTTVLRAYGG